MTSTPQTGRPPGELSEKDGAGGGSEAPTASAGVAAQGNVGNALRSIYQQTVEEDVPDEMIDLLGRLG